MIVSIQNPVVVAVTGASGSAYARRLIECLLEAEHHVQLTISNAGAQVIQQELGLKLDLQDFSVGQLLPDMKPRESQISYYHVNDFMSPIASGSHRTAGMVVCPCSGGTLSSIAHGNDRNLVHRAANVHLKEQRRLVLVPRETPLSLPFIENMKSAHLAGATILPAMPGWYHGVESLDDLVDFVVARILDQLEIENKLVKRWGSEKQS